MSSIRWETELGGRLVYVFVILSWRGTTHGNYILSNNPMLCGTDRVSYNVPHLEAFVFHTRRFLENSDSRFHSLESKQHPRKGVAYLKPEGQTAAFLPFLSRLPAAARPPLRYHLQPFRGQVILACP
jgi:hypothetical protein